jgi:hypothetical protein
MPKHKKPSDKLEILADGVFVAADVRKDKGAIAEGVDPAVAATLIANGHAKRI